MLYSIFINKACLPAATLYPQIEMPRAYCSQWVTGMIGVDGINSILEAAPIPNPRDRHCERSEAISTHRLSIEWDCFVPRNDVLCRFSE